MSYFVYLLTSNIKPNWIYTGFTYNPHGRLVEHNAGNVPSTRPFKPFKMYVVKELDSKKEALRSEASLKKSSSRKKKLLEAGDFRDVFEYALDKEIEEEFDAAEEEASQEQEH